jgi:hypothetical protein
MYLLISKQIELTQMEGDMASINLCVVATISSLTLVSSVASADGLFHDNCGQGDCLRKWITKITPRGNDIYQVAVTEAFYHAGDDPVEYTDVDEELDTVSCKSTDPWVFTPSLAANGEPKIAPEQSEDLITPGDDRTHLWRAVCLGKYDS